MYCNVPTSYKSLDLEKSTDSDVFTFKWLEFRFTLINEDVH